MKKNNTFEVGTITNEEWDDVLLENATYDEAYRFCRDYEGSEKLCLYDTTCNTTTEYYICGKECK